MAKVRKKPGTTGEKYVLHSKITDPELRRKIKASLSETHAKFFPHNCRDNIWLVSKKEIMYFLMGPVLTMSNAELHWKDWWNNGFTRDFFAHRNPSSGEDEHVGMAALAAEIFDEFYEEAAVKFKA